MFLEAREKLNKWISNVNKPDNLLESNVPPLQQIVEDAKESWQQARAYFENVSDPELVDYAIKNLEAAEKRYNYLLKQLREQ